MKALYVSTFVFLFACSNSPSAPQFDAGMDADRDVSANNINNQNNQNDFGFFDFDPPIDFNAFDEIVVTNSRDDSICTDGDCSLRGALLKSEVEGGGKKIVFDLPPGEAMNANGVTTWQINVSGDALRVPGSVWVAGPDFGRNQRVEIVAGDMDADRLVEFTASNSLFESLALVGDGVSNVDGIVLAESDVAISGSEIRGFRNGAIINDDAGVYFSFVHSNLTHGVLVENTPSAVVLGCAINVNGQDGVRVVNDQGRMYSEGNIVIGNLENPEDPQLNETCPSEFCNEIRENGGHGIYVEKAERVSILGNIIETTAADPDGQDGIIIVETEGIAIVANQILGFHFGINAQGRGNVDPTLDTVILRNAVGVAELTGIPNCSKPIADAGINIIGTRGKWFVVENTVGCTTEQSNNDNVGAINVAGNFIDVDIVRNFVGVTDQQTAIPNGQTGIALNLSATALVEGNTVRFNNATGIKIGNVNPSFQANMRENTIDSNNGPYEILVSNGIGVTIEDNIVTQAQGGTAIFVTGNIDNTVYYIGNDVTAQNPWLLAAVGPNDLTDADQGPNTALNVPVYNVDNQMAAGTISIPNGRVRFYGAVANRYQATGTTCVAVGRDFVNCPTGTANEVFAVAEGEVFRLTAADTAQTYDITIDGTPIPIPGGTVGDILAALIAANYPANISNQNSSVDVVVPIGSAVVPVDPTAYTEIISRGRITSPFAPIDPAAPI